MYWLVLINRHGLQAKFKLGKNLKKSANKEKKFSKILDDEEINLIVSLFEMKNPVINFVDRIEKAYYLNKIKKERIKKFYGEQGSWSPYEKKGYDYRKYYLEDYLEVLANLPVNNAEEFDKRYSSINGAIDILYHAEKLISKKGNFSSDPSKAILKLIRILKIEKEE